MAIKGDFLSFKFDGHDISEFGAVRTSDGDRFNEPLQPEIKDITAEVPGMNGEYYFGSTFGRRSITVSFAFDSMTEEQFRAMRRVFACNQTSDLILSERPYKKYLAKIENPIELSYICFDAPITQTMDFNGIKGLTIIERETNEKRRIYKGEGTINFVCYFPFAKSLYKTLPPVTTAQTDSYSPNYDPYVANINEWKESSGILEENIYNEANLDLQVPDPQEIIGVTHIHVYNPGDIATGFRLYCPFIDNDSYDEVFSIVYYLNMAHSDEEPQWQEQTRLTFNPITQLDDEEDGFLIDTNTGLITGVKNYVSSLTGASYDTDGILYNRFIKAGEFFKIQPTDLGRTNEALIALVNGKTGASIFYDYLYF